MWLLDYISTHASTGAHTRSSIHTHTDAFTDAHTQLPVLITYIEDWWLLFGIFDYGFLMANDSPLTRFWPEAVW